MDKFLDDLNDSFARMLTFQSVACHAVSHAWKMLDGYAKPLKEMPDLLAKSLSSVQVACTVGLDLAKVLIWAKNATVRHRRRFWMAQSSFDKDLSAQACRLPVPVPNYDDSKLNPVDLFGPGLRDMVSQAYKNSKFLTKVSRPAETRPSSSQSSNFRPSKKARFSPPRRFQPRRDNHSGRGGRKRDFAKKGGQFKKSQSNKKF